MKNCRWGIIALLACIAVLIATNLLTVRNLVAMEEYATLMETRVEAQQRMLANRDALQSIIDAMDQGQMKNIPLHRDEPLQPLFPEVTK